jgi:hypothetical protein
MRERNPKKTTLSHSAMLLTKQASLPSPSQGEGCYRRIRRLGFQDRLIAALEVIDAADAGLAPCNSFTIRYKTVIL